MIGAQATPPDPAQMLKIFSSPLKTDGGNLSVVILNDRTVDVLFAQSPAKMAFRTKARMTAVFYVQGTVAKDFEFKTDASDQLVVRGLQFFCGKEEMFPTLVPYQGE